MAQQARPGVNKQSARLPLIGNIANRGSSGSKDQRFLNTIAESQAVKQLENTKIYTNKRPGLTTLTDLSAGEGRSFNFFNGKFFATVGNTTWMVNSDGTSPVSKITWSSSTGQIGGVLCNSRNVSIGDYLFLCSGTQAYVIKADFTATAVASALPVPHAPSPTFIDGYVCLAKGSDVYTCSVDDPFTWLTSDYLTAAQFPDPVVALARQNNQVVVFGESSTEFFYDAANPTGSPLARNDSAIIQTGIAAPHVIYQNEQFCIFVGQSDSGGRAVWMLKGFQPTKVSDEYIERILDAETNMTNASGYGLRTKGHMLFMLNLPTVDRTLVYDTEEKLWHEWSTTTVAYTHHMFAYGHCADSGTGMINFLGNTSGNIAKLDPDVYQDEGNPISVEIVTNKYDMDTYNRKYMNSVFVVGDLYSTTNAISLQWTDDDYQTWSNVKTIDLVDTLPAFFRLGQFRRRAFRIRHSNNMPLRLESLEVSYDKGIS